MGRNVFVSYKYADNKVQRLPNVPWHESPKVRNYVDELQRILKNEDHINLGERDGESLTDFADSSIETSLKNKIFQSSITIVIISKGMRDLHMSDNDQWIPWEISYSLREVTRNDKTCRMNAVIGVVLPDENESYDWYYSENIRCNCTTHQTAQLFDILKSNMFNMKEPVMSSCEGLTIHHGEFSFIKTLKWSDFKSNPSGHMDMTVAIRDHKDQYKIKINLV